jgi:hypothetical protein
MVIALDVVSREAELERQVEQLEAKLRSARELAAQHMFERFHAFDAIKDDSCPACGGRVKVVETHNSVTLEAIGR